MSNHSHTDTEARPQPRWAQEVAPAPNGHDYFDPNHAAQDLPATLARHHIARAFAFYQGTYNGDWSDGIGMMLTEYQLATIWCAIATTDSFDGEVLGVEIVTDLASPHVLGPNILTLLEWANIDPQEIRAYGPAS